MLARRRFARAHRHTNWSTVVFVDEKKFSRYANPNNRNNVVWAHSPTAVPAHTVRQGGPQLMVWAGMCSRGVTPLARISDRLTSQGYIHILRTVLLPSTARFCSLIDRGW